MKKIILIFAGLFLVTVFSAQGQFRYGYPGYRNPYYGPQRYNDNQVDRDGRMKRNNGTFRRQGPSNIWLDLNYAPSQPLGSLKDYANKSSLNGFKASVLYQINPQWTVGLSSGFQDFYERIPRQLYHDQGSDISAVQTHTLQLIPIQPTALYFFGNQESLVKPYVGLGIGVTDVNYKKYWGAQADRKNQIGFSASPMVGIRIPFSATSPLQFNADAKYNYVSYSHNEIKNISTVGVDVGLTINIR